MHKQHDMRSAGGAANSQTGESELNMKKYICESGELLQHLTLENSVCAALT